MPKGDTWTYKQRSDRAAKAKRKRFTRGSGGPRVSDYENTPDRDDYKGGTFELKNSPKYTVKGINRKIGQTP